MTLLPEVQAFNDTIAEYERLNAARLDCDAELRLAQSDGDPDKVAAAEQKSSAVTKEWAPLYDKRKTALLVALRACGFEPEAVKRAL